MIVHTIRMLRRIQAGLKSSDPEVQSAAESCLSCLVRHLRDEFFSLPKALEPLYTSLPDPTE